MIHLQSKGKGILVFVYAIVPFITLQLLTAFINEYCFDKKFPRETVQLVSGISLLVSGLWTYKTADDFYIDKNGEKQFVEFEHKFMFLDMKTWPYIFWVIGSFTLIGGVIELIDSLSK